MINHAFSSLTKKENAWIINSGATCHMCNDASFFVKLYNWEKLEDVALGDWHVVKGNGREVVKTKMSVQRVRSEKLCPTRCSLCPKLVLHFSKCL